MGYRKLFCLCVSLLLCFLSFFLHANVQAEAPTPFAVVPVRVMSWNVQFGEGTDAVTNYDRTASWIASVNPDLVGLCEVPSGNVPDIVNALIEIPQNSKTKYEIDKTTGLLKLDRVIYSSFHYPFF